MTRLPGHSRSIIRTRPDSAASLLKIEKEKIWLASPAVREPLRLPLAGLRSLIVNQAGAIRKEENRSRSRPWKLRALACPAILLTGRKRPTPVVLSGNRGAARIQVHSSRP